jgi:serine/threonine-protein kinase
VKQRFAAALQLEPPARQAYLDRECAGDLVMRAEVESLLAFANQNATSPQPVAASEPSPLASGTRLGDYEVVSLLGSGGFGGAYRARDLRLQREVAIKVLPSALSADAAALRRFEREALAAARLNHPHIVTIHSIEHAGDVHLIVMELVEGQTLDCMIPQGGLSLEKFLDLATQLADAVAAAHGKGIIHRDLKPGNIMVDNRGSIKILDFGIAKMTELTAPDASDLQETEPGLVMGTVPYMSPEQLEGKKLGCHTDIFSLGAVLYQMATGQRPFQGETHAKVISSILRDQPRSVMELRADLPASLQRILERCLAKEVGERYAASELCEAVQQLRQELTSGQLSDSTEEASVAVMPFLNLSADPENEFFADGMTEDIINALGQIKKLHVAARTSSMSFKGRHADLRTVGGRLNVRTVLEGSIRRSGSHLRVTAQLVNVADGYHLWSEKYDREMKDVFEIQDEISRSIAERLKVSLETNQPLVKAGTENLEAYQLYLKGRALFFQRGPRLRQALQCFEGAVALDSNYASAWAGLADARHMVSFYGLLPHEQCVGPAREAALRAVQFAPVVAEGHAAVAFSHLFAWDLANAELEFLRALELNPRDVQARDWYGVFYLHWATGRTEEAIDQLKTAIKYDPLSAYAKAMLAVCYSDVGMSDEALQMARAAVDLDPDSFVARWFLQVALHHTGRFTESVAAGEVALALSGRHPYSVGCLALAYADWGRPLEAQALYMELRWRAKREYVQPLVLAWAASAADDQSGAIELIREAYKRHDPNMIAAKRFSAFSRLHGDPRFQEILDAFGFQ